MDSSVDVRSEGMYCNVVFDVNVPGRECTKVEGRFAELVQEAFARLVKEVSQKNESYEVEVLWDRGIWRRDPETTLPCGFIWAGELRVWPFKVLESSEKLL